MANAHPSRTKARNTRNAVNEQSLRSRPLYASDALLHSLISSERLGLDSGPCTTWKLVPIFHLFPDPSVGRFGRWIFGDSRSGPSFRPVRRVLPGLAKLAAQILRSSAFCPETRRTRIVSRSSTVQMTASRIVKIAPERENNSEQPVRITNFR